MSSKKWIKPELKQLAVERTLNGTVNASAEGVRLFDTGEFTQLAS